MSIIRRTKEPVQLDELIGLRSLEDHPRLRVLIVEAEEAQRQHRDAERQITEAETALEAEEHKAAIGERDDKRLIRAREAITGANSELRIAAMRARKTQEAVAAEMQAFVLEAAAVFRKAHAQRASELKAALDTAAKANAAVAQIESAFSVVPRNIVPIEPIPLMSWPELKESGRYEYWRRAHGFEITGVGRVVAPTGRSGR